MQNESKEAKKLLYVLYVPRGQQRDHNLVYA